jgi:serine/threonine-protein kinase
MPYEQAVNGGLVDSRSDLFALGATLYHLLTGQVPFRGATPDELVSVKARGVYQPARELRPEIPEPVEAILTRSLAHDPRERYQTAGALIAALTATGIGSAGTPSGWPTLHAAAADDGPSAGPDGARTHANPAAPANDASAAANGPGPRRRSLLGVSAVVTGVGLMSANDGPCRSGFAERPDVVSVASVLERSAPPPCRPDHHQ